MVFQIVRHEALSRSRTGLLENAIQDYPNPLISEIESLMSTDYYVTQGNFQISTGYRIRF
jgi:hypothetical protein